MDFHLVWRYFFGKIKLFTKEDKRNFIVEVLLYYNIYQGTDGALPRCKPFKYTYEKEIVMYAYFKNLDYFSTECIYSPNAYR